MTGPINKEERAGEAATTEGLSCRPGKVGRFKAQEGAERTGWSQVNRGQVEVPGG